MDMPKTDAEWKSKLTPEQYRILRQKGTEPAGSGKLLDNQKEGEYICVGCGQKLFNSTTKFDSHCGWPSFYDVADKQNVKLKQDSSHDMERIEVMCSKCQGHLGHVFNDAPDQPTGLRFCINSASLKFMQMEQKKK